ncbi:MAG: hypothetical protein H0W82_02050 [Actinobacteria bacterium]|nr:hypothetical protein [Actinomycetota bacterium]
MDPREIFELIIKADEKLKYATDANRETREHQARELLSQALEAAREAGNAALIAQAEQRLTDLGMPPVAGAAPGALAPPPRESAAPPGPHALPATPLDEDEVLTPQLHLMEEGADENVGLEIPPELGTDAISILEGSTFMVSDSIGDVPDGVVAGLFHDDTRFLSKWVLTIDGERPRLLTSDTAGSLFLHGIHAFGTHYDVEASGRRGEVRPTS